MRRIVRFVKRHLRLAVLVVVVVSLSTLMNVVAYIHAGRFINLIEGAPSASLFWKMNSLQRLRVVFAGVKLRRPSNHNTPAEHGLLYEAHRYNVDDKITLEAWHVPCPRSKGIVLMFHGYLCAKSYLLAEASAFHELGYSTFLVDFRGSGGSTGTTTTIGYHEADDVTKTFEYVKQFSEDRPIILFGQSMGAAAVLRAVAVGKIRPDAIILEGVFDRLDSTVKNRFSRAGFPAFPMAHLLIFWGGVQADFPAFSHNPVEYASKVNCPVLMLHGTEDRMATFAGAETVFQNLRGEKQFQRFEGLGHEPYLAGNPELWKTVISQFLDR